MAFRDIVNSVMGLPQGSPGLKESLRLIGDRNLQDRQERLTDSYVLPEMVYTRFGGTDDSGVLNEWAQKSLAERLGGLSLDSQYEQPQMAAPEVQGIATQYEQPVQALATEYPQSVLDYSTAYKYSPAGEFGASRLDAEKLGILWNSINKFYPDEDQRTKEAILANTVAIAQAESGIGGAYANPKASNFKHSNYWNWFKNRDRSYDPENFEEMSDEIIKGLKGYVLDKPDKRFTFKGAEIYTGKDNAERWYNDIYIPAMKAMGY